MEMLVLVASTIVLVRRIIIRPVMQSKDTVPQDVKSMKRLILPSLAWAITAFAVYPKKKKNAKRVRNA